MANGKTAETSATSAKDTREKVIADGVKAGDIISETDTVTVSEKASPTGKKAEQSYIKLTALTFKGMMILCNGKVAPATTKPRDAEGKELEDRRTDAEKAAGVADYFNYGWDLDVRARVRATLFSTLEGPEKAIQKAVTNLVANAGMDADEARTFIVAQRKKAGLAV